MMKKQVLVAVLGACMAFYAGAQGYDISFQISGLADTTIYLGNYFAGGTYVKDTTKVDQKGRFVFKGEAPLSKGLYFLVLNKTKLVDLVIGDDQEFTITTDLDDLVGRMKVEGDVDNKLLLEDKLYNADRNKEAKPYLSILKDSTASPEAQQEAKAKVIEINKKVEERMRSIATKHEGSTVATFLKANLPVDIPDEEKEDSVSTYFSYKKHYWDHFDLGNPMMLRMPTDMYAQKLEDYFEKLVAPVSDSVTKEIGALASVAKQSEETYQHFVWNMTLKYQRPKVIGLDGVIVYLYDTFYATGEMDFWANDKLKENIKERADQLRNSLLGMKAHNLVMQDDELKKRALYDMTQKYVVIYFYDPDCGHCKKETPVLKQFYDDTKHDVGVFTVSADTSMAKMREYITKVGIEDWVNVNGPRTYGDSHLKHYDAFSTPTLYLLNEDKEIIGKKIPSKNLEEFIDFYEERKEKGLLNK